MNKLFIQNGANPFVYTTKIIIFFLLYINLLADEHKNFYNHAIHLHKTYIKYTDYFIELYKLHKWPRQQYINSYVIRGLNAKYAISNKKNLIKISEEWSDKQLSYQAKMFPKGSYYMGYGRKPGEKEGEMFIADNSCIAMAILSTSVYTSSKSKQNSYVQSVKDYADMVIKNYVRKSGGVTDGIWKKSDDEWWCSTALFSSVCFQLYAITGEKKYYSTALHALKWLIKFDFTTATTPDFKNNGQLTVMFYSLEAFTNALYYVDAASKNQILNRMRDYLTWIDKHLTEKMINSQDWWGVKVGGIPYHIHANKDYIFHLSIKLGTSLDSLQECIINQLVNTFKEKEFQKNAFTYFSLSEILIPGATYQYKPYSKKCDRFHFDGWSTEYKKGTCNISFKVIPQKNNKSVAFYLYKGKKKIATKWYTRNPVYDLNLSTLKQGSHSVRYFIVNESEKHPATTKNKIIGTSKMITISSEDLQVCKRLEAK